MNKIILEDHLDEDMNQVKSVMGKIKRKTEELQDLTDKSQTLMVKLNDTFDKLNVKWMNRHRRVGEKRLESINDILKDAIEFLDKLERKL